MCIYMGNKGELFGTSFTAHPSNFNDYVAPFIVYLLYYMLMCAAPMLITFHPTELGPGICSFLVIWNGLANGVMIYVGLSSLEGHLDLTLNGGMAAFICMILLMAIGLVIFFKNTNESFNLSLFWRRKSGKNLVRDCWLDDKIWAKEYQSKKDEQWGWIDTVHPIYLPFDLIVPWFKDLVDKYENEVERPEWLDNDKFVKRIVTIFRWRGTYSEEVNEALFKIFGRGSADHNGGVDGQLSYIKKKVISSVGRAVSELLGSARKKNGRKVEPEGDVEVEIGGD